jgi:hypothetical protein
MAVTRKMVDEANENVATTGEQFASELAITSNYVRPAEFVIYRLTDTKKNGRVHIDGVADAWNPKLENGKGRMDRIWLLTGAQTIWQSELGDLLKDKEYLRTSKRSLIFESRVLRVPIYDKLAIEFLEANPSYVGDGTTERKTTSRISYYKWDTAKQQKAAMAKKMLGVQMVAKANEQPVEKMRQHAFFLGISLVDEMGIPKTDDGIRMDYMVYANDNPEQFQSSLDSKEVSVKYLVRRAILDAKIDIGSGHGRMKWAKTGGYICTVPAGMEATRYLMDLALTNTPEGESFLKQLQENLN